MAPYVVLYKPVLESLQLILREPSLELESDEDDAHKVFNDIPDPEIRTLMKEIFRKVHHEGSSRVCKKTNFMNKASPPPVTTSPKQDATESKRPTKRRMDHANSRVSDDTGKLSKKKKSN